MESAPQPLKAQRPPAFFGGGLNPREIVKATVPLEARL